MSNYKIDPSHSEVTFKVKHLMISTVTGQFADFDASFQSESSDFSDAKINFNASIASLSTNNAQRDEHLKSPDFFDASSHPKLEFVSTSINKLDDSNYELHGDLNLRGVSKPITLKVEYAGGMTDPYGQEKHGFEISGKINRKEFGLNWSAVTEAGGIVVSDDVKIAVNAQFIKI
jgi:polyisoprenoid-binding protein YceI